LDKANLNGKDKETNRHKIHPHVLRKFFRSNAGRVSVDMAEALMGHSAYLTDVYRKYANPEETLGEFYKKVESSLEIFGTTNTELKEKTEKLRKNFDNLYSENVSLKQQIGELEKTMKPYMELYEMLEKTFGEKDAPEQLKRLFLANIEALEQYPKK
jgi:phosphoglycerate-specific signal transduction histidine kinase